jgi:hypothetical protein
MDQLKETFLNRWSTKEDPITLWTQINKIKKLGSETVRDFNTRFEQLFQRLPSSHHPGKDYLLFLYIQAFQAQFQYLLKDKGPTTIQEAQEIAIKIEANLSSCKVEPFISPRTMEDIRSGAVHNVESTQDASVLWARFEEAVSDFTKNQALMMNIITELERALSQAQKLPSMRLPQNTS